jgi:predicted transcriptional regulator
MREMREIMSELRVRPSARHVLRTLLEEAEQGTDVAWINKTELAKATGLAKATIDLAIQQLRLVGLVGDAVKERQPNGFVKWGFQLVRPK